MAKTLVVLSLLVASCYAVTNHALSEIVTQTLTTAVTAQYPDAGVAPVITQFWYSTTWDSSAYVFPAAGFQINGYATITGNNTVSVGYLTLVNGGDSVLVGWSLSLCVPLATNTFNCTIVGSGYPLFRNTGLYSVSNSAFVIGSLSTVSLPYGPGYPNVAGTKYTAQTISVFNFSSPQSGGCDTNGCTRSPVGNIAITPGKSGGSFTTILRSPTAASGTRYITSSLPNNAGVVNLAIDTSTRIQATIGGLVNGLWSPKAVQPASSTLVPQGQPLFISAQLYDTDPFHQTYISEATVGALQSTVTLTGGSTDVTAPTCSVATLSPATITTQDASVMLTLTITCSDGTGSGIWTKGAFLQANTVGGATYVYDASPFVTPTAQVTVYPHLTGSVQLIGVWAADLAGNVALYGSCGGIMGYDSICGGGSSSASTISVSIFALVVLALSALSA